MQCSCGRGTKQANIVFGELKLEFERCAACGRQGSYELIERYADPRVVLAVGEAAKLRMASLKRSND